MCGRDDDPSTYPKPECGFCGKPAGSPSGLCADCDDAASEERCPACGELSGYCLGHGEIGDPAGYAVLLAHDERDEHGGCHPAGCSEKRMAVSA